MIKLLYDGLFLPLLEAGSWAIAPFHTRARQAFQGRRQWNEKLMEQLRQAEEHHPRKARKIMFHSPSVGEFLQARPIIDSLKESFPDTIVILTFYSPSAEPIVVKYPRADVRGYLPIDTRKNAERLLTTLKPDLLVFSRGDLWPNLILEGARRDLPMALAAGTLIEGSGRTKPFLKGFFGRILSNLDFIGAISNEDRERFLTLGISPEKVVVTGDTRYDQAYLRATAIDPQDPVLKPFDKKSFYLIAGSTWPKDEDVVIEAFELVRKDKNLKLILVPHEPTPRRISGIKRKISHLGLSSSTLSEMERGEAGQDVVIVDRVGVLAKLYRIGKAAFIGGSFLRRVHNVIEPASLALPVIVGPKHKNSREATLMIQQEGAFVAENRNQMAEIINKLASDESFRKNAGERALKVIEENLGATEKTVKALTDRFQAIFR